MIILLEHLWVPTLLLFSCCLVSFDRNEVHYEVLIDTYVRLFLYIAIGQYVM